MELARGVCRPFDLAAQLPQKATLTPVYFGAEELWRAQATVETFCDFGLPARPTADARMVAATEEQDDQLR